MKHIRSWLKFCLLLPCMAVRAQQPLITSEYAYRHYTTQDGLPKMYIECLFQDSKGFIWVGSLNGLVRYNGLAFETFQGVENAEITAMCESASRNLMAFGPESYHIFDYTDEKFIEKTYPDKFYFNELASRLLPAGYAIFNRIDGDRKNKLLCRIANETVEVLLENPALNLMRDNNGALFEPEQAMLYLPCDADSTVKIITMKGEQLLAQHLTRPYSVFRYKGRVYCVAENGIFRLCDNRFEPFIPHHFPVAYSFIKTAEDKNGALIISDMKNVYRLNGDRLEKIFGDANLIIDICIDREGNLWLATYQGVFNLFRQEFKNYILSDRKDMFRVIAGNPDREEIFTGTFDGKLLSVTSNGVQAIAYPSNPEGYFFENYCASTAHSVFLPAAGRVLKVETGKTSWLNLPEQEYRAIAAMPDGNLIAGWEGNFVVFSPYGKLIETLTSEDLLQFCYSRPCFDSQGNLYLGGSKGITRWSRNNPLLLTHPELKPCRILRNDNDGNIWAASRNRLFKLENGRIHPFKELKGEITNIFFTKNLSPRFKKRRNSVNDL